MMKDKRRKKQQKDTLLSDREIQEIQKMNMRKKKHRMKRKKKRKKKNRRAMGHSPDFREHRSL